jgi:hypothetical protein
MDGDRTTAPVGPTPRRVNPPLRSILPTTPGGVAVYSDRTPRTDSALHDSRRPPRPPPPSAASGFLRAQDLRFAVPLPHRRPCPRRVRLSTNRGVKSESPSRSLTTRICPCGASPAPMPITGTGDALHDTLGDLGGHRLDQQHHRARRLERERIVDDLVGLVPQTAPRPSARPRAPTAGACCRCAHTPGCPPSSSSRPAARTTRPTSTFTESARPSLRNRPAFRGASASSAW